MIETDIDRIEHICYYNLLQWKKRGAFDIFNDISEYITLVQFIHKVGHLIPQ